MVKKLILIPMVMFIFISFLPAEDAFERNCVKCHEALPTTMQEMFKRYLLLYGGVRNFEVGLKYFLKHPNKYTSAMSALFIESIGIKEKSTLKDEELTDAINIYWEKYKVFGRLK